MNTQLMAERLGLCLKSWRLRGPGSSAFGTELGLGWILSSTTRAPALQRRRTLDTALRPYRVVRTTVCTTHAASLLFLNLRYNS